MYVQGPGWDLCFQASRFGGPLAVLSLDHLLLCILGSLCLALRYQDSGLELHSEKNNLYLLSKPVCSN